MPEGYVTTHVLDAARGSPPPASASSSSARRRAPPARPRGLHQRRRPHRHARHPQGRSHPRHLGAPLPRRPLPGGRRPTAAKPPLPRPDPDPLRHRGRRGPLPRPAAAGAVQLLDVSRELTRQQRESRQVLPLSKRSILTAGSPCCRSIGVHRSSTRLAACSIVHDMVEILARKSRLENAPPTSLLHVVSLGFLVYTFPNVKPS